MNFNPRPSGKAGALIAIIAASTAALDRDAVTGVQAAALSSESET
tara:strand:+ start:1757 stop:1891 length:135 start_codon:yes stop_codon:yes gene_type:complete